MKKNRKNRLDFLLKSIIIIILIIMIIIIIVIKHNLNPLTKAKKRLSYIMKNVEVIYNESNDKTTDKSSLEYERNYEQTMKPIESNDIMHYGEKYPDGAAPLGRAYKGDLKITNIGKSMYYVVAEFLPEQYEKLRKKDGKKLEKYYEKNSELIEVALGIENKKKFIELIKVLKELNVDILEFESFYIDIDSIKNASTYTSAVLNVKYKNCEEISINMRINNKKHVDISSIIYTINK